MAPRFVVDEITAKSRVLDYPVKMILRNTGAIELYAVDEGREIYAGNLDLSLQAEPPKVSALIQTIRDRIRPCLISPLTLAWLSALQKVGLLELWQDPPAT